jgi:hypothetical protein
MNLEEIEKRIKNLEEIYSNARQSNVSNRFLDKVMNDLLHLKQMRDELQWGHNHQNVEKKSQLNS